jgi:hypothetical protein
VSKKAICRHKRSSDLFAIETDENGKVISTSGPVDKIERRFIMRTLTFVIILALTCVLGCASLESMTENEKEIPLSQVPKAAIEAAEKAVENITLTEAEVEEEDGRIVYELEGTANGTEYEIEVTADGKVLEVEQEDENEDDD